jgi:hypothetical protein
VRRPQIAPKRKPYHWRSPCRILRNTGNSSWSSRSDFPTKSAAPALRKGWPDRVIEVIRDRFGWDVVGYAPVMLGASRSVPDEFR